MRGSRHLALVPEPPEKGLFDLVPCGLVICDAEGRVIRANGFFRQMSGLEEAMFAESRPFQQYLTRPSRFIFSAKILPQLLVTGEVRETTLDILGPQGEGIAVLLNANYDRRTGQHHLAIFPARDRREHERQLLNTQKELTQSRDYLQLAEKLAHVGHFHSDLKAQTSFWSPEIYNILGLDAKTYVPKPNDGISLYHEDDQESVRAIIAHAIETGEGFTFRKRLIRPGTGEIRHVEASAVCERDIDGAVVGLFGVFHDISDIVLAQEEVARSESRYRLLADNASDVITVFDTGGCIEYISPSIEAVLGFAPEHFIGRSVRDLILPDDYPQAMAAYRSYIMNRDREDAPHIRYRIAHADGHPVWLEAHPKAIRDADGRITRYQDVVRDITQQKSIEDALARASIEANAAADAKAEFLATMSHELRTPLTSIIGYSSLLRDLLTDNEGLRRHSQRIHSAGNGLLALINDILDHSKLEAGQLELDIEPCPVAAVTRDVLDLLQLQAEAKGLELIVRVGADVPDDLMLDEQRLRQILMNLIGNAIKFTDQGQVTVTLRWEVASSSGQNHLYFSVTDTGPGISSEDQAQLFQRFSQLNKASKNQKGTGLGLLICKQLVTLMGGHIGVDSRMGQGSTFWFDVPACGLEDYVARECGQ